MDQMFAKCLQNVYYVVTELVFFLILPNQLSKDRGLELPRWIFRLIQSHLTNRNNQQLHTQLILPEDRSRPDGLRDVLVWNHRKFF